MANEIKEHEIYAITLDMDDLRIETSVADCGKSLSKHLLALKCAVSDAVRGAGAIMDVHTLRTFAIKPQCHRTYIAEMSVLQLAAMTVDSLNSIDFRIV